MSLPARVMRSSITLVAGALLVPLVGGTSSWGQDPKSTEAKAGGVEAAPYARTPDKLIPYRSFEDPYYRFFQTVTEFLGTGREKDMPTGTPRLGVMAPVGSAPDADIGTDMLEGVRLAVEQANANGGYRGKPLSIAFRPDTGAWGASSNEMVAFTYEDEVLAVIGSIDGANTHIALRAALKTQTVIVNTGTTDPTLTETRVPWLIRCMADDRQQGYALAHYMIEECGIKSIAALRVNDRYGRMGIGEFRDAARRLEAPLRAELRFSPGDREFSAQLSRIRAVDAEAVVVWANAADAAAVVRAIRAGEKTNDRRPLRIFGCDRLVSEKFRDEAGEAAEGVVAVATFNPADGGTAYQTFRAAFEARFDRSPGTFAAHAYDGTNMVIDALRKAGLNRVRIRDALAAQKRYVGVTGVIEFDTTHNDVGPVYIATVKNGTFAYEKARFAEVADGGERAGPYRRILQSPPRVRLPGDRPVRPPTRLAIGCFVPLDDDGQAVVQGLELALEHDAARHAGATPVELIVRDARSVWGQNATALVDLVFEDRVLAIVGSTERRGTHLVETLAAKMHFPVMALCDEDPTITQIPLPWVFSMAGAGERIDAAFARDFEERFATKPSKEAAIAYDAGALLVRHIRGGAHDSVALRQALAGPGQVTGVSGTFSFDPLGNRVDFPAAARARRLIEGQ